MLLLQTRINGIRTPFGYRITTINARRKISRPSFRQPRLDHLGYGSPPISASTQWSIYLKHANRMGKDVTQWFRFHQGLVRLTFKVIERKRDQFVSLCEQLAACLRWRAIPLFWTSTADPLVSFECISWREWTLLIDRGIDNTFHWCKFRLNRDGNKTRRAWLSGFLRANKNKFTWKIHTIVEWNQICYSSHNIFSDSDVSSSQSEYRYPHCDDRSSPVRTHNPESLSSFLLESKQSIHFTFCSRRWRFQFPRFSTRVIVKHQLHSQLTHHSNEETASRLNRNSLSIIPGLWVSFLTTSLRRLTNVSNQPIDFASSRSSQSKNECQGYLSAHQC